LGSRDEESLKSEVSSLKPQILRPSWISYRGFGHLPSAALIRTRASQAAPDAMELRFAYLNLRAWRRSPGRSRLARDGSRPLAQWLGISYQRANLQISVGRERRFPVWPFAGPKHRLRSDSVGCSVGGGRRARPVPPKSLV